MGNTGYIRSRNKENEIKHDFEKEGWYAIRAAGSKGIADIVAIRPALASCDCYNHYEVRFIQIKTSKRLKNKIKKSVITKVPFGSIDLELWKFPVR